jgi:hypothetical protein
VGHLDGCPVGGAAAGEHVGAVELDQRHQGDRRAADAGGQVGDVVEIGLGPVGQQVEFPKGGEPFEFGSRDRSTHQNPLDRETGSRYAQYAA